VAVKEGSSPEREIAQPRRRRRAPEDARQEILSAASAVLAERPAHELTVVAIMERTTLSRKSFYVYFRDRSELVSALVRPLRVSADAALADWRDAAAPVRAGRLALRAAADTYRRHGAILRAVFWSLGDDPEFDAVRRDLAESVVAVAREKIRQAGTASGRPLDAQATAVALVTMNVHCLLALPPEATDNDLDALVDTLSTIWERTLYPAGHSEAAGSSSSADSPTATKN
jgi:TetR/AcrR family transcriptional regulator, ethionamide resistance regulator